MAERRLMKVDPSIHLPIPNRVAPPIASPAKSFENILVDAAQAREMSMHRALGFSELGMFGRQEAVLGTCSTAPPSVISGAEPHPTDEVGVTAGSGVPVKSIPGVPEVTEPPLAMSVGARNRGQSAVVPALSPIAAASAEASVPEDVSLRTPAQRASSPRANPVGAAGASRLDSHVPRAPAASEKTSLVLTEREGRLQIIAASGEARNVDWPRLRSRMVRVAAEHGMTLTDLTLDGATVEASFTEQLGSSYGHRSR